MKKQSKWTWRLPFLAVLLIGTILIIRQQQAVPYQTDKGFIFGTTYTVTYQNEDNLQSGIVAELMRVDSALSMFNAQSVISLINRNERMATNNLFCEVFTLAQNVSEETGGAFDITVAPLVNLWGFGFKKGAEPSAETLDSLRQLIGYKKAWLEPANASDNTALTLRKADPRIMLDCSAIAKGYGADIVARYLRSRGIQNFMIEIGGEVITCGNSPKRLPWKIGVTKPSEDSLSTSGELQTVLNVTDKAMATSGNYRNFYYKGGKKYAHTIDPATGYPVQHSLLSATVLAADCATADAYATAFMVMGMEKAKAVLSRHPELMAYFIYSGNNGELATWYSPSMQDKIIE